MTRYRTLVLIISCLFFALLALMIALELLRAGELLILVSFWVLGVLALIHERRMNRDLSSVRRSLEASSRSRRPALAEHVHALREETHAELDAIRQLLDAAQQQTSARLARLEQAIDECSQHLLGEADRLRDALSDVVDARLGSTESLLESTIGLQAALGPLTLPPMRDWASSPDYQSYLYRLVRALRPSLVVECGSGVSTVVVAAALASLQHGSLVSLEHDEWNANRTRSWLVERGLEEHADVLLAPLGEHTELSPPQLWYTHSWLDQSPEEIDLLIVAGPPNQTESRARFPALPVLRERLRADGIIVLDDARCHDERDTLVAWNDMMADHSLRLLPHVKGTGVLFPAHRSSVAQWID